MKRFLVILLLFFATLQVNAQDMFDVDYNFIDTAFDGIQPITDKQFDETVNRLTPQPVDNSFGGKLKTFLFGRKYGVEPQAKGQDKEIDLGGEMKAIQDLKNGVFYIKLIVSVYGNGGQIIPAGNYKIQEKTINNDSMLVFYQGHEEYGMLKLRKYEDTKKKENDLNYYRIDVVTDDIVRIVYSTIKDTKCALAKVYLQN